MAFVEKSICALTAALAVSVFFPFTSSAQVNVVTQHNDIARTGQNTNETILTPANVSSGNFGKLFSVSLDGQVYAQPLYLSGLSIPSNGTHNVVFMATMHDSVYALDADSGTKLWQITLLDSAHGATSGATTDPVTDTGCTEMSGTEIGITSTPVIDPVAGIIYVVGRTYENAYPVYRLHALSVTTGAEMTNSPVTLSASVTGTGTGSSSGVLKFDPLWENQRPGLLLLNGIVYIGFAGYCDNGPWHGWVLAYNVSTMKQTSVFTPTPNAEGSGIWMSGTGLAADVPSGSPYGRLFIPTGNGTYDATTPYGTNTMDYGVDVLRLDLTNGVMTVSDAFTPMDQASLNANDQDMSSGGVLLLPPQTLAGHTNQLLAAGKTGNFYVVDRDNLGGYSTTANNIIEYVSPNQIGGAFSGPAYWNNTVYYWGDSDTLKQFQITNGLMNFWHSANSSESMNYPGSSPSISANGTTNGIVWDIDGSAYTNSAAGPGPAILYAHSATAVGTTLYSSATNATRDAPGQAVKMTVPTVVNGKVYVPTYGELDVYGLLTANFSLTASSNGLTVQQGSSNTDTLTVTPTNGFTGTVSLTASGLPSGLSATFAAGTAANTTIATFTATSAAATGTYPVTITGTSASITQSITVNVTVTAPSSFTVSAAPNSVAIVAGQSGTSNITVTPLNGFTGAVTLSATGMPSGVSASLAAPSGGVSVLTIATTSAAATGTFSLAVTGTSGSLTSSTNISVTISAAPSFALSASPTSVSVTAGSSVTSNITIVPSSGFTGTVSLAATGLPTGVSASFGTTSNNVSLLTITASSTAAVSSFTLTVTGTSNTLTAKTTVSVSVTAAPSFTLSASPASLALTPGTSTTTTVTIAPANGFTGSVALTTSGLPSGVTASFGSVSGNTSLLTLTASSTAATGTASVTITGTSGAISAHTAVTLSVALPPSFTLSASPNAVSLVQGNSGSTSITIVPANGFSGTVSLAASGLPSGVTVAFGAVSGNSSTLTLTATNTASVGTVSATITGTSGSLSASTSLSLTISQAAGTAPTIVSLSSAANVYGIFTNGTAPTHGGYDNDGYAYSSNLLGSSVSALGVTFTLGSANAADAVSNTTVTLPQGSYAKLNFLGSAVNGNQVNQSFKVTYTDGSTSTFTQSLSDWYTPQSYSGETKAVAMSYRVTPSGADSSGQTFNLYAYSFTLNTAKTVKSITLPANRNVVVLAITLSGQSSGPQTVVAINSGGSATGIFAADNSYSGGSTSSTTATINTSKVSNPAPQAVYQTERYGAFTYSIGGLTANATYTVELHFAEICWTGPRERLFSVAINGTTVLSNFDIYATAGGENIAIAESFTAKASASGVITIQFIKGSIDNPKISGIQILN